VSAKFLHYLLRPIIPTWRFFAQVTEVPELLVRIGSSSDSLGPWQLALTKPKRALRSLIINHEGNLYLAYHSLLERVLDETAISTNGDALEETVSFRLVKNLANKCTSVLTPTSEPYFFQFQIVTFMQGSSIEGSAPVIVSRIFESTPEVWPVPDIQQIILFTKILLATSVAVQSLEFLLIRESFADKGVWRWKDLRLELAHDEKILLFFYDWLLAYKPFLAVIVARLIAALGLLFVDSSILLAVLFFSSLLICVRFRGSFNGGSDYMTVTVSGSLFILQLCLQHEEVVRACIYFIACQSVISYCASGLGKLFSPDWVRGRALNAFVDSRMYGDDKDI
jgi:hypothetical protein